MILLAGPVLLVLSSCDSSPPPDRLTVLLSAEPMVAMLGDTIHLVGVAHNPTDVEVRAGLGCSPGIGFYVLHPDGEERSLYDGLAFNCPVRDDQILEPGETDSVSFPWIPAATGSYHVRAVVLSNGPRSPSQPSSITVH